jgi:hypothetical protein
MTQAVGPKIVLRLSKTGRDREQRLENSHR